MGVRLTILDKNKKMIYNGSKLCGYADKEDLSCIKWLLNKGKIDEETYNYFDEIVGCSDFKDIYMNAKDIKDFLKLYIADGDDYYKGEFSYYFCKQPEIQKIMRSRTKEYYLTWW